MSVRWWARRLRVHQPVEISSPLSVEAAAARLEEGLFRRWSLTPQAATPRSPAVMGRVRDDRARLVLARDATRNSWRPILRARLEPESAGCRSVGRIGTPVFARWLTTVWALAAAGITVAAVVLGIAAALAGTTSGFHGPAGRGGVPGRRRGVHRADRRSTASRGAGRGRAAGLAPADA